MLRPPGEISPPRENVTPPLTLSAPPPLTCHPPTNVTSLTCHSAFPPPSICGAQRWWLPQRSTLAFWPNLWSPFPHSVVHWRTQEAFVPWCERTCPADRLQTSQTSCHSTLARWGGCGNGVFFSFFFFFSFFCAPQMKKSHQFSTIESNPCKTMTRSVAEAWGFCFPVQVCLVSLSQRIGLAKTILWLGNSTDYLRCEWDSNLRTSDWRTANAHRHFAKHCHLDRAFSRIFFFFFFFKIDPSNSNLVIFELTAWRHIARAFDQMNVRSSCLGSLLCSELSSIKYLWKRNT